MIEFADFGVDQPEIWIEGKTLYINGKNVNDKGVWLEDNKLYLNIDDVEDTINNIYHTVLQKLKNEGYIK